MNHTELIGAVTNNVGDDQTDEKQRREMNRINHGETYFTMIGVKVNAALVTAALPLPCLFDEGVNLMMTMMVMLKQMMVGPYSLVEHDWRPPQIETSIAFVPPGRGARVQWNFQFPFIRAPWQSTSAMKVSIWGGRLHFREVGE
ncbi:hypothetical protein Tco_1084103 [Tanacetum coccineum]